MSEEAMDTANDVKTETEPEVTNGKETKETKEEMEVGKDDTKKVEESKEDEKKTEDAKKKKKKIIDKAERPPLVRVMRGTVIIRKLKMKDAKMKDFLTILSKAESFTFEFSEGEGTMTLNYCPYKDFKAMSIIQILCALMEFAPEVELDTTDEIKNELEAEKYGIRRQLASQTKDKTLYVNNITGDTSPELLRALVPDCSRAILPEDANGERKGWAVLEFVSPKDADDTMKNIRNIELGTDNKVAITRSESMDPQEVEKAREEYKNKPTKKTPEKKPQDQRKNVNKFGKRKWNQDGRPGTAPSLMGPAPLLNQPRGMGRGGLLDRPVGGMGRGMGGRMGGGMGGRFSIGNQLAMQHMNEEQRGWGGGDRPYFGGNEERMVDFLESALHEIKHTGGSHGMQSGMQGRYGYDNREEFFGNGNFGGNDFQNYGNSNYGGGYNQGMEKRPRLGGNMGGNMGGGMRNQNRQGRQGFNIWDQSDRRGGGYY